jgi:hypothetical protein
VGPKTDGPIQWANLPTFSNNHRLFPMHKECTNLLPTMQPVSHLTEMARMSMHFPTMLLRFPGYHNTKLDIAYGSDYNFATVLQFQSTFQSYRLPPYWQFQQGEISMPAYFWLNFFDVYLTFPAQAQRSPRKVEVYNDEPSLLHAMNKDFVTGMFDEDTSQLLDRIENPLLARLVPMSHHTIAQFPVHNNSPDVRLRKYKFQFENSANQVQLLDGVRQFQFQDVDYDLEYLHRIDIVVNRVLYIMMKFVTEATLVCDEIKDMTHFKKKIRTNS